MWCWGPEKRNEREERFEDCGSGRRDDGWKEGRKEVVLEMWQGRKWRMKEQEVEGTELRDGLLDERQIQTRTWSSKPPQIQMYLMLSVNGWHLMKMDCTNFPASGHLEHFQQRCAGGLLFQSTRWHFALHSGLYLIAAIVFNKKQQQRGEKKHLLHDHKLL